MKVIVTEEQIKRIIREEAAAQEITDQLSNETNPNTILNTLATAIKSGGLSPLTLPFILKNLLTQNPQGEQQRQGILQRLLGLYNNNGQENTENMENRQKGITATDVSNNALSQICRWETSHDFGYKMPPKHLQGYYHRGEAKKTYGYGLKTHPNGKWMEDIKQIWTQPELEAIFREKIEKEAEWVLNWANKNGVKLGQGQLDAMVSAVYNYGRSGFLKTGVPTMIAQNPDNPSIPEKWSHLSDARAKKYPGLVSRRTEEANWYKSDIA